MNRKILSILLLFIIFLPLMGFTRAEVSKKSELTEELKENLIPIKTIEAGNGFEDLMPLKEILDNNKIIAMGEATHGTAEFFQMKHRIFEFLVHEMGYRVFAMEANFGSSKIINDYILYGRGSVDECLKVLEFWTWDTKEVADMIKWMREFNVNAEDNNKIRFYGFDMQSINNSLIYVLDYLTKVGSSSIVDYNRKLKDFNNRIIKVGKREIQEFTKDIDEIHKEIVENKNKYIKNSSMGEYEIILHNMEIIYQYIDFTKDNSFNKRDYYMAENVNWILEYEKKYYGNDKIMLWGHNGHIANDNDHFTIMGKILKDFHGDKYYSIGFDFYEGSFVAMTSPIAKMFSDGGLAIFHIDSAPKDSFAHEMMKTEVPISFLDFKNVQDNKTLLDFIAKKIHVNGIGAVYTGKPQNVNSANKVILKDTFDAMIFVKSTTEAIRSRSGYELPDGNKSIIFIYIINIVIIIVGLSLLIVSYFKRLVKLKTIREKKYYILGKNEEGLIDKGGIKGLVVKANNYFNSITIRKYWAFLILFTTILNIISAKINSLDLYYRNFNSNIIIIIINLLYFALEELINLYLIFVLPLKIAKKLSNPKSTNFIHIMTAAIIGTFINTLGYRHSGLLLHSINILLSFIGGLIYCYSYDLFYYRGEKPIVNFYPIFVAYNILMNFFAMLIGFR